MNPSITKLFSKMIIFGITIMFFSCEKDLYENSLNYNNLNQLKVSRIKYNSISDKKITDNLQNIKKVIEYNKTAKIVKDDLLGITIDTDEVLLIQKPNYTSYTFPIYRENSVNLENLVIVNKNNTIKSYIVSYHDNFQNAHTGLAENTSVIEVNFNTSSALDRIYYTTSTTVLYSGADGSIIQYCDQTWESFTEYGYMDVPNPSTGEDTDELISTNCYYVYSFGGGSGGGEGDADTSSGGNLGVGSGSNTSSDTGSGSFNGAGTSGGGTTTSPTVEDGEILTTPVMTPQLKKFNKFIQYNGTPDQKLCYDNLNDENKKEINNLLNSNSYNNCGISPANETELFNLVLKLIEEICDGNKIDFENKIILDPSFQNNQKAMCVYNKMKQNNAFNKLLNPFNLNDPEAFIKFKTQVLDCDRRAETYEPDSNQIIEIVFNSDPNCNNGINFQPNLMFAQTMAHEVIHAEFFRQIIKAMNCENYVANYDEIVNALKNSDYQKLAEYFRTNLDWSHNYMAEHFRKTIARVTQEFDTGNPVTGNPIELYMVLAWRGLNIDPEPFVPNSGVTAWTNLPEGTKIYVNETISNYVNSNSNQLCQ